MDLKTIQSRIAKADWSILEAADSIPDSDYSSLSSLCPSPNLQVREVLVRFALAYKGDWSRELCFALLKDSGSSVRTLAASGLQEKARPQDAPRLLQELERQYHDYPADSRAVEDLVLAGGNTGDAKLVEPLLTLRKKESDPELRDDYDKALAKLGYLKEIRLLHQHLEHGPPAAKGKAMTAIRYINKPEWVKSIAAQLRDEQVVRHLSLGPATFTIRVCDDAINTLRVIDTEKRVPADIEEFNGPYPEKQLSACRKAYGVSK